jgi:hypothetical protein
MGNSVLNEMRAEFEQQVGKDEGGTGYDEFQGTLPEFVWKD